MNYSIPPPKSNCRQSSASSTDSDGSKKSALSDISFTNVDLSMQILRIQGVGRQWGGASYTIEWHRTEHTTDTTTLKAGSTGPFVTIVIPLRLRRGKNGRLRADDGTPLNSTITLSVQKKNGRKRRDVASTELEVGKYIELMLENDKSTTEGSLDFTKRISARFKLAMVIDEEKNQENSSKRGTGSSADSPIGSCSSATESSTNDARNLFRNSSRRSIHVKIRDPTETDIKIIPKQGKLSSPGGHCIDGAEHRRTNSVRGVWKRNKSGGIRERSLSDTTQDSVLNFVKIPQHRASSSLQPTDPNAVEKIVREKNDQIRKQLWNDAIQIHVKQRTAVTNDLKNAYNETINEFQKRFSDESNQHEKFLSSTQVQWRNKIIEALRSIANGDTDFDFEIPLDLAEEKDFLTGVYEKSKNMLLEFQRNVKARDEAERFVIESIKSETLQLLDSMEKFKSFISDAKDLEGLIIECLEIKRTIMEIEERDDHGVQTNDGEVRPDTQIMIDIALVQQRVLDLDIKTQIAMKIHEKKKVKSKNAPATLADGCTHSSSTDRPRIDVDQNIGKVQAEVETIEREMQEALASKEKEIENLTSELEKLKTKNRGSKKYRALLPAPAGSVHTTYDEKLEKLQNFEELKREKASLNEILRAQSEDMEVIDAEMPNLERLANELEEKVKKGMLKLSKSLYN